jgi:hypothetical protein
VFDEPSQTDRPDIARRLIAHLPYQRAKQRRANACVLYSKQPTPVTHTDDRAKQQATRRPRRGPARVLLMLDRPVTVELIKLTLNHGVYLTQVVTTAAQAATVLQEHLRYRDRHGSSCHEVRSWRSLARRDEIRRVREDLWGYRLGLPAITLVVKCSTLQRPIRAATTVATAIAPLCDYR